MRLLRKISLGGFPTLCHTNNLELMHHQQVCNQLLQRISTRGAPIEHAIVSVRGRQLTTSVPKIVALGSKNAATKLEVLPITNATSEQQITQPTGQRQLTTAAQAIGQRQLSPAAQAIGQRQLSTTSQACTNGNGEFQAETDAKPYGTHRSSGAVVDPPTTNKIGCLWALALVVPGVYIGGMLSSFAATMLSEYEIFVVDDDDDD